MTLKRLGVIAFILATIQASQAQLHVEPKSWPGPMGYEQMRRLAQKTRRAQLHSLEAERRSLLRTSSPSSPQVRRIEKQIRQLSAQLKSGSSPERSIPPGEKKSRKFFAVEIGRLQQEKRSLLRKFKPNSPVIAELDLRIRILREQELSLTRPKTEYLSS